MSEMNIVAFEDAYLEEAITVLKKGFKISAFEEERLRQALESSIRKDIDDPAINVLSRKYWVALSGDKVAGVIGLMELDEDYKEAYWVNWYCVAPAYRGKGYGRSLLEFAIAQSRSHGKKLLRVWTSDSDNEKGAQYLYQKMNFNVTMMEAMEDGEGTHKIYREFIL